MSGPAWLWGNRRPASFWVGLVAGWAIIVVGAVGVVREAADTHPGDLAGWVIGSALVHDGVWAVGAALVAVVVGRLVPARFRPLVLAGLAATGLVVLISWPLLTRYGERPGTPSGLPLDYRPNVVGVVAVIWLAVAVAGVRRARRTSVPRPVPGRAP